MRQDVIELRARDWIPRNQTAAPTTLAEVHEAAAKEKETASRPIPMSRNSSRRGNNRGGDNSLRESTADGWSSVRSLGRTATLPLSINSTLPLPKDDKNASRVPTLPRSASNMFHALARNPSDSGMSRTPHTLTRNASESGSTRHAMTRNPSDSGLSRALHSMSRNPSESGLSRNSHAMTRVPSESGLTRMARNPSEPGKSRTNSRRDSNRHRPGIDFDQLNAVADSGSVGRRKLQLLPRSVGVPVASSVDSNEDFPLGVTMEEPEPLPSISESQVKVRVEEDVKELFQIHDLTEGIRYFETLPGEYRHLLVDKVISKIDAKESDVSFIEQLFTRVVDAGMCNEETFERGFAPTTMVLDDISVDVPTAYVVIARLLLAAKLSYGAIGRLADSITYEGNPLVRPSDKLWKQFRRLRQEEKD
jgi:translation initiation factor 4G